MRRVNYGLFMGEKKGITEAVLLGKDPILGWDVNTIGLESVEGLEPTPFNKIHPVNYKLEKIITNVKLAFRLIRALLDRVSGPMFYEGTLDVTQPIDTFMSFRGWNKGVAFVNGFNLGRFWPSMDPQCTLFIHGPLLRPGENKLIILELESSNSVHTVELTDRGEFSVDDYPKILQMKSWFGKDLRIFSGNNQMVPGGLWKACHSEWLLKQMDKILSDSRLVFSEVFN